MNKHLVAFTIDDNYAAPFCVAIASFAKTNDVRKFLVGLVYSEISKRNLQKIRKFLTKNNIDYIEKRINDQFKQIKVGYHFNSVIFYRLLLPDLFQDHKIMLYTDSDMLFLGDIESVYKVPVLSEGAVLAAISKTQISGVPNHLKGAINSYFASGFLLINSEEFKRQKILEKVLTFLENSIYDMPDQDALNSVVHSWIELDKKFGVETSFLQKKDVVGFEHLKSALDNPVIIQFSGRSKPWNYKNQHPYKEMYWNLLQETPYARRFPVDMPKKLILKELLACLFTRVLSL